MHTQALMNSLHTCIERYASHVDSVQKLSNKCTAD